MWRLVAACGGSGQASRQPLRGGTPPQCKAKPLRGRLQRALHCSSPVPVAAQVLRGGPAPTSGGFGAVRPSGPVGGAPASLASPATPAAQAVPRGSAYALAARRSGAAALAASSGQAGPRPAACGLAPAGGRNLYAARKGRNALRAFAKELEVYLNKN